MMNISGKSARKLRQYGLCEEKMASGKGRSEHSGRHFLFDDEELAFAETHLRRIQQLGIRESDNVLIAISISDQSWLEVVDACIYAGADFILPNSTTDVSALADSLRRQKITAVAVSGTVWEAIRKELAADYRKNFPHPHGKQSNHAAAAAHWRRVISGLKIDQRHYLFRPFDSEEQIKS